MWLHYVFKHASVASKSVLSTFYPWYPFLAPTSLDSRLYPRISYLLFHNFGYALPDFFRVEHRSRRFIHIIDPLGSAPVIKSPSSTALFPSFFWHSEIRTSKVR
jgi:hypothetical protein